MNLRDRIFDRFFADIHDRRLAAAVDDLREGSSRARQMEGFRRLTEDGNRDLNRVTLDKQREIAVYLYTYNMLARRILETMREWILGEGVTVTAEDPTTEAFLQQFWNDRTNRWDIRLWEQTLELYLMGERFWPVFTNEYSGLMRFGVLDPSRVKKVITNPDNVEQPLGIVLKSTRGEPERRMRTVLSTVELDMLTPYALAEWEGMNDGELMQFAVNKLSTQSRGVSELFAAADWLDGYESLLFSILQREKANSMVMWDVTLEGADDEAVEKFLKKQTYPKPLSMRAHNEKVKWELQGPAFGSSNNNVEHSRLFRNHVLSGQSLPEHWFGGGGDVNRATGESMHAPTEKSLTAKQRHVKHILTDVIATQIDRGVRSGNLADSESARAFTIQFPELSTRDLTKISSSIQGVATAFTLLGQQGWLDDETPVRVLSSLLQQMGVDRDPEEMLAGAREQRGRTAADEMTAAMDRRMKVVN